MVPLISHEVSRETCKSCGTTFEPKRARQTQCKTNCRRGRSKAKPVTFCAIDGEGLGDRPDCYVLLSVGSESIENPEGLNWRECFEFLYGQFLIHPKGTAFIGFYLGYDFTQILKSLPEQTAWWLFTDKGKATRAHKVAGKEPHPVQLDGWQFDILGMKRLRIRPKRCDCQFATCSCEGKASWMYICDVGGFWQCSFLSAIEPSKWETPVVSAEEYAIIERGKALRSDAVLDDDMREYNLLENRALERAMSKLNEGFESVGIHLSPSMWFGPGQASAEWLKKHVRKSSEWFEESVPQYFREAARASYFGGWFEIFAHGHVRGTSHEYDINSAYPHIIATLPCLQHGVYSQGKGRPPIQDRSIFLVRARVRSHGIDDAGIPRNRVAVGAMLHRDRLGNISRPVETEGWFWWDEIEASIEAGLIGEAEFKEWVGYDPCECPPPFADIARLYTLRLGAGKASAVGKAIKLLCNSCYGKFAQSIGRAPFGNPVWASRITSGTRRVLIRAIGSHPDGVESLEMVATDAVFFRTPHPGLEVSSNLGEFEHVERENLTLFKPGVYWDDKAREDIRRGDRPRFKARGVDAGAFARSIDTVDELFGQWERLAPGYSQAGGFAGSFPSVAFQPGFTMVSPLQALVRGKWHSAGTDATKGRQQPLELEQNSDPSSKRIPNLVWDGERGMWKSEARWMVDVVSKEYVKRFGMEDPWSDFNKEAMGISQDGLVGELMRFALKED